MFQLLAGERSDDPAIYHAQRRIGSSSTHSNFPSRLQVPDEEDMITREMLEQINAIFGKSRYTNLEPITSERRDQAATQHDKPSARSPYSEATVKRYLRNGYPSSVVLMGIQNTNSMEPLLDFGDIVALLPVKDPKTLRVGDIITYSLRDLLVLHRIAEIKNGRARMKGDNNWFSDGWIPLSAIQHQCIAIGYGTKSDED